MTQHHPDYQALYDDYRRELPDWEHEGWEAEECAAAIIRRYGLQDTLSPSTLTQAHTQFLRRYREWTPPQQYPT